MRGRATLPAVDRAHRERAMACRDPDIVAGLDVLHEPARETRRRDGAKGPRDIDQLLVQVSRVRHAVTEVMGRGAPARHEAAERRTEASRLRQVAQQVRARAVALRRNADNPLGAVTETDPGRGTETDPGRGGRHPTSRPTPWRSAPRDQPTEVELRRAALHESYATTRDPAARAELVASYDGFARSLALRYRHREPIDDLHQVARLALLHAVDRFDPALGRPFPLFARMTIDGELKRHLRDKTWAVRVPRSLQEDYLNVMRAVDDLTAQQSDSPSIGELADRCGLSVDRVIEAMDVRLSRQVVSFDLPAGGREGDGAGLEFGRPDAGFEQLENRELLGTLLSRLPERDRRILEMRFIGEMTQAEIAAEIGVSQMCVSRVLARTLGKLRLWARAAAG